MVALGHGRRAWHGRYRGGRGHRRRGRRGRRCRHGHQAHRQHADQRHRGDDQARAQAREGRGVLQHEQSPLEAQVGGRGAGEAGAGPGADAQLQQQASVVLAAMAVAGDHRGIDRRLAGDRVLAGRQVHQRVEEEQVLGQRRHQPQPQVMALQVHQLVGQGHVQVVVAHARQATRRQQQHRPPGADQLRRIDGRAEHQPRRAAQAVGFGRQLQRGIQAAVVAGPCRAQQGAAGAPGRGGAQRHHQYPGQPQRHHHVQPRPAAFQRQWLHHDQRCGGGLRLRGGGLLHHVDGGVQRRQHRQLQRRAPDQADQRLQRHQPPQPALGCRRQSPHAAAQHPHQRGEHDGLHAGGEQAIAQQFEQAVHDQSSRRCDCSLLTSASSSASSLSLTSAFSDIHATNGEIEPCRVFSTKLPTALLTTSCWCAVER